MPLVCLVAILRPWGVTATQWPVVTRLHMTTNSSKRLEGNCISNVTNDQLVTLNFGHFWEAWVANGGSILY